MSASEYRCILQFKSHNYIVYNMYCTFISFRVTTYIGVVNLGLNSLQIYLPLVVSLKNFDFFSCSVVVFF